MQSAPRSLLCWCCPNSGRDDGGAASVAFDLAFAMPLLWRSRWPFPVFLVTAGIAFVQWLAGLRVLGDVALLIALYTVASREDQAHESRSPREFSSSA